VTEKWTEEKVVALMDEAFSASPGDPVHEKLRRILEEKPEFNPLWQEYRLLRKGMESWSQEAGPSEMTRERILKKAARGIPGKKLRLSHAWRLLLSQPVVAAATVLLIVGVGIYSHYWVKQQTETQTPPLQDGIGLEKVMEEEAPPKHPPPSPPEPARPRQQPMTQIPKPKRKPQAAPSSSIPEKALRVQPGAGTGAAPAPPPSQDTLDRAAPTEAAPMGEGLTQFRVEPSRAGETEKKEVSPKWQKLISQAKRKMKAGDYAAALKLLREAEQIQSGPELEKLIQECTGKIKTQPDAP
jgi:hypothetical protein